MNKKIFFFGLIGLGLAAAGFVISVVWFFIAFFMSMERGEEHRRQLDAEQRSGKWDFGDQPALFAVAHAIVKNDQEEIRAAAKALPDLQAPGRDCTTLLYFAVTQGWQRPELVEAVKTLLSLGADPNYTNHNRNSFAMANAVHGSALLLRYTWVTIKMMRGRGSISFWIAGRTSIPRCPSVSRILPVIRCCFTAQKWDSTTTSPMRMR